MWDKLDKYLFPASDDLSRYVRNPLWDELCEYMAQEIKVKLTYEYSGCSIPGWNVKFKKSGRNLCTFYPSEGFFTVLIVIGKNEKESFEKELSSLSPYLQDLYNHTQEGMGQRWLFIDVEDESHLEDIKRCIAIRRGAK